MTAKCDNQTNALATEPGELSATQRLPRLIRQPMLKLGLLPCFATVMIASDTASLESSWAQAPFPVVAIDQYAQGTTQSPGASFHRSTLQSGPLPTTLQAANAFRHSGPISDRTKATECLAAAAWYEVGNDAAGQRAVIQTVLNRVNHSAFPNSVCGVVFEGSHLRTGCQFTFTCDGSLKKRRPSEGAWERAQARAEAALKGSVDETVGTATHYHADYVTPWWSNHLERLTVVGPHIFYRWYGSRGSLRTRTRLDAEHDFASLARKSNDSSETTQTTEVGAQSELVETAGIEGSFPGTMAPLQAKSSAIFSVVDIGQPTGRWAVSAMNTCKGNAQCQVIGYSDEALSNQNRMRSASERDRPAFLFIRDETSGMQLALWDCARFERKAAGQCLPASAQALTALMRER